MNLLWQLDSHSLVQVQLLLWNKAVVWVTKYHLLGVGLKACCLVRKFLKKKDESIAAMFQDQYQY